MSRKLEKINSETIYKLCSGQVIIDLGTTIKELLENSLDSGATSIDIRLKNYGLNGITVTDNGSGISSEDFPYLCRKNWTSKIQSFDDLTSVTTFGFRGEALSSICSVSQVSVTTCTSDSEPKGFSLEYSQLGELTSCTPTARECGTTVKLENLFKGWPVRFQEFKKNIRRDFTNLMGLVLRCQKSSSLLDRIGSIFGNQLKEKVFEINKDLQLEDSSETKFHITGYISNPLPNSGKNSSDKQYIYLNGKPCEVPKIKKVINEVYREFNPSQHPIAVINIQLQPGSVDFNVSPDKRSVFIKYDQELADFVYESLRETFIPSKMRISVGPQIQTFASKSFSSEDQTLSINDIQGPETLNTTEKRPSSSLLSAPLNDNDFIPNASTPKKSRVEVPFESPSLQSTLSFLPVPAVSDSKSKAYPKFVDKKPDPNPITTSASPTSKTTSKNANSITKNHVKNTNISPMKKTLSLKPNFSCLNHESSVKFEFDDVKTKLLLMLEKEKEKIEKALLARDLSFESSQDDDESLLATGISNQDPESAALALSRTIKKQNFKEMEILGQFNLGFIIAKLGDDLYIIDQHASDEKFNFENLQAKSVILSQPLIMPMTLELGIADENAAFEYKDILSKNGFVIKENPNASPGYRVQLLSQPFIEKSLFTASDLKDLLSNLRENPSESVRCARARSVFASRACRKSIMIGDPLNKAQMTKIVRNLGNLEHPWNCPHGRPTLRHLTKLEDSDSSKKDAEIITNRRRPMCWSGSLFT
ncbi:hypothetical protein BB560_007339 [Smittium megazygosporum]|uniref:MutL C-terminal dimerisation domain-containing protein n=1 Tax=Smittium megazygosporum TaxID=133381 RepID=A0A2T9XWN0_9FUNG|nr:hypothetical protein BB560_007339 [Smittium megazygosporum]